MIPTVPGEAWLGLAASSQEVLALLANPRGQPLERLRLPVQEGDLEPALRQALRACAAACLALPALDEAQRAEAESFVQSFWPPEVPLWLCSTDEATLAGGLGGQAGLMLEEDGSVLGRDRAGQLRGWLVEELGLSAIATQFRRLGRESMRVQRSLERLGSEVDEARLVRELLELASFPGPEPACKALVSKLARQYSDALRSVYGRFRFPEPPRGAWRGTQFGEPLVEFFGQEMKRYLPSIRWGPARFPPEAGCVLLLKGALAELRRQQPDQPLVLTPGIRWVDEEAWRQLSRDRELLPAWTPA